MRGGLHMREIKATLLLLLLTAPAWCRDDDYYRQYQPPQNYRETAFKFTRDAIEGSIKGDFIERPNFAQAIGNIAINFTPAVIATSIRDFSANFLHSYETDFKEHKVDMALAAIGIIPAVSGVRKLEGAYKAGCEARLMREAEMTMVQYAPALESGLTRKLQASIVTSIKEGEIIGVRQRAYLANFLDGKLPAKPAGAEVVEVFKNGVRKLSDGSRVISDVDLAFVSKNGRALPESKTLEIGGKINETYGHAVVMHGDNFSGVKKGVEGAIEAAKKQDDIYIFTKQGFIDAGNYEDMIDKYIRRR